MRLSDPPAFSLPSSSVAPSARPCCRRRCAVRKGSWLPKAAGKAAQTAFCGTRAARRGRALRPWRAVDAVKSSIWSRWQLSWPSITSRQQPALPRSTALVHKDTGAGTRARTVAVEKQMFNGMRGYATTSASNMLRGAAGLQYLQCRCASCPGPASCVSSHGPWTFAVRETSERAVRCESGMLNAWYLRPLWIIFVLTGFTSHFFIFVWNQ